MKKLTNTLKAIGFTGLMAITGCLATPKFNERYGNWLFMQNVGNYFSIGYDTNGDDKEDLRLIYRIVGASSQILYLKLEQIARDKNNNQMFEEDEYEKVKSNEIIELENSSDISV